MQGLSAGDNIGENIALPRDHDDDFGKDFFSDFLQHISTLKLEEQNIVRENVMYSGRDLYHGTREDLSTESGITVSDESSLLHEARPSPVDLGRQRQITAVLIKFLHVRIFFSSYCK